MLENLVELPPIRRLREVIRKWWGIELFFIDIEGKIVGFPMGTRLPPPTPVCEPILGNETGFMRCLAALKQGYARALEGAYRGENPDNPGEFHEGECHAGFHHLALPIRLDGMVIGFLLCDGLLKASGANHSLHLADVEKDLALPTGSLTGPAHSLARLPDERIQQLKDVLSIIVDESVGHLVELRNRDLKIVELSDRIRSSHGFQEMIGRSAAIREVFDLLEKIIHTDVTVLIQGENGAGKEMIAKALHEKGPRKGKAFIAQNCANLSDQLLESELFGHLRGAFTGAIREHKGILAAAHEGTFFLDEIGEMPAAIQAKLLRFLQDGTFTPVGSTTPSRADVRIIAATNRDLNAHVQAGQFREDLFYRLNVITLRVPPLRERIEDLPLLADHFLKEHAVSGTSKRLNAEALQYLMNYNWPGNVRELKNEIERLIILSGAETVIEPRLLSPKILQPASRSESPDKEWETVHKAIQALARQPWHRAKERWLGLFARPYLEEVLKLVDDNVSQAAKLTGLPRSTFYRLLHRHGLMKKPH